MSEPDRGNGLRAASYVSLVDLAPELTDTVLDALRVAGIAAYVTPAPPEELPAEPAACRDASWLYVDAEARDQAKWVLDSFMDVDAGGRAATASQNGANGSGPRNDANEDEIWNQLVASYDEPPASDTPPWPAREDFAEDDRDGSGADERSAEPRTSGTRVIRPAGASGAADSADSADGGGATHRTGSGEDGAPGEDDDHFVPPAPPPLPRVDALTKTAWGALFGGPCYLLLATVVDWHVPGWAAFAAVAAFVGGFVTLVVRMGDTPPDSGSDDGAVV